MRIAIATPARDEVNTRFAFDMVSAVAYHVGATHDEVIPLVSEGTIIASQRTALINEAMKLGASHLVFIDSDMRFPQDTIGRLLAHHEKIVAANCARRRMPTGPTAGNYDGDGKKHLVYTMPEDTGLERVGTVGTGVMLIDLSVFQSMPVPWFASPWVADKKCFMGEDVFFCMRLGALEIPIYIDHDLSKEIGHVGTFEFRHEHTWVVKNLEEKRIAAEQPAPLVMLTGKNGTVQ